METPPAPAPAASSGFWRRHRAAILTIALVLYTLALAVGVADDVLHLGLFPTELERRTRVLIAQFDSADPAVGSAAAGKLVRDIDTFVAIPELIRALGSASDHRRSTAIDCLRQLTRTTQGYEPDASPAQRRAAIKRWQRWWQENKERF